MSVSSKRQFFSGLDETKSRPVPFSVTTGRSGPATGRLYGGGKPGAGVKSPTVANGGGTFTTYIKNLQGVDSDGTRDVIQTKPIGYSSSMESSFFRARESFSSTNNDKEPRSTSIGRNSIGRDSRGSREYNGESPISSSGISSELSSPRSLPVSSVRSSPPPLPPSAPAPKLSAVSISFGSINQMDDVDKEGDAQGPHLESSMLIHKDSDDEDGSDNISLDYSVNSSCDSYGEEKPFVQTNGSSLYKNDLNKLKSKLSVDKSRTKEDLRITSDGGQGMTDALRKKSSSTSEPRSIVGALLAESDNLHNSGMSALSSINNRSNHAGQADSVPLKTAGDKPEARKQSEPVQIKVRSSKPEGFVGFASLPDQVYRRAVRKGFDFTLMVVGESGLGKSTLVNSMFLTDIYTSSGHDLTVPDRTLEVETHTVLLEEKGVRLFLTVVDTPGFGDSVDNTDCWVPVIKYIEDQFDKFLEAEQRVNRVELRDARVHACLYFIAPTGHGLRQLDIEAMKRLHDKVNVIPVIGKSDSCTPEEINNFKLKILNQLKEHNIKTYDFPPTDDPTIDWMRQQLPFAVVGSNTIITTNEGKKVRGRSYPWGSVNIEDRGHCDFSALRSLLLSHHMQDLKDVTNFLHYETYRCKKLTHMLGGPEGDTGHAAPDATLHPLAQIEQDELNHEDKIDKMNYEMESVFRKKVEEKERKMRQEELQMQAEMEEERRALNNIKEDMADKRERLDRDLKQLNNKDFSHRQKSMESLSGKKKKYALDKVIPFKFSRA